MFYSDKEKKNFYSNKEEEKNFNRKKENTNFYNNEENKKINKEENKRPLWKLACFKFIKWFFKDTKDTITYQNITYYYK